eukprot:CAMPEP_0177415568 /NCGR_PEP_ID=MMETSP0368-20130122/67640_1 /TAXON_ID=447022 ORGANISM="Scrippsiella hangoei-like, Strain SHHI-4" /NCGR_SAMPLE_ID=MMETSP0368 /ASSEMBLY_ACC=CAM_ASM_000363 /LENGTH=83 /DNA_ID=CAMNT_0018884999 /DNA_START=37 /DNA_END=288 /DNA_ORIENTATION=+
MIAQAKVHAEVEVSPDVKFNRGSVLWPKATCSVHQSPACKVPVRWRQNGVRTTDRVDIEPARYYRLGAIRTLHNFGLLRLAYN